MPVYEYTALDIKGKEKNGYINADSHKAALQKLRTQSLYPRQLQAADSEQVVRQRSKWWQLRISRINPGDVVITVRQLSTLLSAGLPLATALDSMLNQMEKGALYKVMAQIRERINEGYSLAAAMEEQSHVFPSTFTAMIKAGESSGTLELVLERLADFGEQQQALKRQVISSLAYPALILLVSLGVIFFLMSYVVPKVSQIFLDFDKALPLPTLILIKTSGFIQQFWWIFPLILIIMFFLGRKMLSTPRGKKYIDAKLLQLPLFGTIIHSILISRFSHTLGTLLKNEVSLLQSLNIVRNVVPNTLLQEAVDKIYKEVSEGSNVSKPLSQSPIFSHTTVQLIAAGEQSGQLDEMFLKVAQDSENYITNRLSMLTALLEPIMILVLGGIVGFVVLAVLLPIFDMSQLVQN